MKIFGREPALIIGLIGAVLTVLAGLNLPFLSATQATSLGVFIFGCITAWATRPVAPALFVAVAGAGAVVLADYGFNIPEQTVAAIGGLILAVSALFGLRPAVTPADDPAPTALDVGSIR
jgi:hypothetical protein